MASVLVVDDEEDIRELIRLNLELEGHAVRTVADGHQALAAVDDDTPDVVVLDVMMPGLDGWGVLSRLKASGRAEIARVPVVLLTARTDDIDRIRGGIEGAIHYVTKPFALEEVRRLVRTALEGEPEPVKRRRVQHDALERLARLEQGKAAGGRVGGARPRLTKLETGRTAKPTAPRLAAPPAAALRSLSPKQRELLAAVGRNVTVRAAAEELEVSRSNVYASLRRIARRLDMSSVAELVALARQGGLSAADGD